MKKGKARSDELTLVKSLVSINVDELSMFAVRTVYYSFIVAHGNYRDVGAEHRVRGVHDEIVPEAEDRLMVFMVVQMIWQQVQLVEHHLM